jgi:AcrR family transcriptional regulator
MSSAAKQDSESPVPAPEDQRLVRGRETREQLLAAAASVLGEDGYGAMSMRAVADRAGVRLSLVHYHFGSKAGLMEAVLDHLTEGLLERQQAMWNDGRPFADQWRTACDYLREDVSSGYVRTLWEIWAAGLAEPALAKRWRETQRGWRDLLVERLERWHDEKKVDLPMRPQALAALIGNLFEGAETEILAGVKPSEAPHLEALEAIGDLIERAEKG